VLLAIGKKRAHSHNVRTPLSLHDIHDYYQVYILNVARLFSVFRRQYSSIRSNSPPII